MKVKINDTIYDSNQQPIMIILEDDDKEFISSMKTDDKKYCSYPKNSRVQQLIEFMEVD